MSGEDAVLRRINGHMDRIERSLDEMIARLVALEARLDSKGIGPDRYTSSSHTSWRAFNEEWPLQ